MKRELRERVEQAVCATVAEFYRLEPTKVTKKFRLREPVEGLAMAIWLNLNRRPNVRVGVGMRIDEVVDWMLRNRESSYY